MPNYVQIKDKQENLLFFMLMVVIILSIVAVFFYAPTERQMGTVQRIFYYHVGLAWNSFLAFFILFIASILYLIKRAIVWDRIAQASGEIGVIFTSLVLITGPLWAHSVWNTWWTWDPRLTTTLILWFMYLAYSILRHSSIQKEQQKIFAAVYGIIAFINVPIVFMSIRWWRTIHPVVFEADRIGLTTKMLQTMIFSLLALTSLMLYFIYLRYRQEMLKSEVSMLKKQLMDH